MRTVLSPAAVRGALLALVLATAACQPAALPAPQPAPGTQAAVVRPPGAPERWREVVGIYARGADTLSIVEKDARLHLLAEGIFHPLTEIAADTLLLPGWGRFAGGRLVFARTTGQRARRLEVGGARFEPVAVGGGEGETFRITPLRPVEELRREALAARPPTEQGDFREPDLVELATLDPTLRFNIRYATTNNFMGAVFYPEPRAFLQRPAAEALVRAHRRLREQGYGLLIFDAYRPWYVTRMFWDATPEEMKHFVADPSRGSRHNRGAAVDLTLFDLQSGRPVVTVSGYDEFSPRAYPHYPGGTSLQRWHRELLREAMEAEGFVVYEFEWWHFDYRDWRQYPILNRTFDQLAPARSR